MRYLAAFVLMFVFAAAVDGQDKPLRIGEWSQLANDDGSPFVSLVMPTPAGGSVYVMYGAIHENTINKHWSILDRGVARLVRTGDGQPFQGLKPCTACGVALAAQQSPDVLGGIRYWRITGALAEPIMGADGKPFMLVPEFGTYEPSSVAGPRPELCPYFLVRRGDRAPWLCRLDGLVARRVDLPKEIVNPRCAWTGKQLILCGGRKSFLLGGKEPVELKDSTGITLNSSAFQELVMTGDFLLVNPGNASRCKLFRISEAVATQVALPEASTLIHLEPAADRWFALVATQASSDTWNYGLCELKDGKFSPNKALDKWQAFGRPEIHDIHGQLVLEFSSPKNGWALVWVTGGEAKVLMSRPTGRASVRAVGMSGPKPGSWLLKLSGEETTYWQLSATGSAKQLTLTDDVTDLTPGAPDSHGVYARLDLKGGKVVLAYRSG